LNVAPRVAVVALHDAALPRARGLAHSLGCECLGVSAAWRSCTSSYVLLVDTDRLSLAATGATRMHPVCVDFAAPELRHRLRGERPRGEDLVRAVGLPARRALHIVDATAGWGRDSAVLAACGCKVRMLERNPVVAALLEDGLRRARECADPWVRALVARLECDCADARLALPALAGTVDVVLLDPMFPARRKSAAVGKEMRFFHDLVGDDADAAALLEVALASARHRVVVKRPFAAPALEGPPPTHALRGRSTRFDVYALRRIE
jgi:16S rRNA (guanine1516-N2)-methyltransferase